MERKDVFLAIAAVLLIAIVIAFLSPGSTRVLTKELCEDSDGIWNGTDCICGSSFQCPPGYYCRPAGGTGICESP